ncbi:hypothetical protein Amsp01_033180 [Amycolatopsis sp. NBRC 101858]|uniref:hypothetical protein n=1 Tax=Amycolatopsis sp. NBRC 101858 TaxID=3032200 RepID=UPI0024A1ACF3|nr:hypothetical protein [Amycolatopsis sp. NBRC 101858]GLY37294.1 hypothetical protein Amsp01_033180 [Amycolatopsis sp. NBRC 101858]
MTAANGAGRPCRFCGTVHGPRVPGKAGPICVDCVRAGLRVVRDGADRETGSGDVLAAVTSPLAAVCEFCGRRERRTFLGLRRPLLRVDCAARDAVICADCLDHAGDVLNLALRH